MNKTVPTLVPQYLKQFSCIGSACEDNCCLTNWIINVDRSTYKKYKNERDPELSGLLNKYVKRNRAENVSDMNYATIKLTECGCAFLTEDKLCSLQLKKGADYLSHTCVRYPRFTNFAAGRMEISASVSCPEVARVALLNPEPMQFDIENQPAENRMLYGLRVHDGDTLFWDLRIFTIEVLQNRSYPLADRLILLGLFYRKVQEKLDTKQTAEIPALISSFRTLVAQSGFDQELRSISPQLTVQIALIKEVASGRGMVGVVNERYSECYSEFLAGVGLTEEATLGEITKRYQQAYEQYYLPFMGDHEYIYENYLVNYVFKEMFPYFPQEANMFERFMIMVLHYAMIKVHLIGMAGFHKGLTMELIVKCIQSYSKSFEHNKKYISIMLDWVKENQFNSMPYVTILIKN